MVSLHYPTKKFFCSSIFCCVICNVPTPKRLHFSSFYYFCMSKMLILKQASTFIYKKKVGLLQIKKLIY